MAAAKLAASGLLLALCLLVSGTAAGRELQASRGDLRACKYEVTASRTGLVNLVKNLAASGNRITYTQVGGGLHPSSRRARAPGVKVHKRGSAPCHLAPC